MLRNEIKKLYPILKENRQSFFIFSIGCYPAREDSNHEFPKIISTIENLNLPIYKIFIDSEYKKDNQGEREKRLGVDSIIYPENINYDEYNMILEFAHIVGNLNNSLTIIMEFTGVQRYQYESKYNKTPYLYITESDCMSNTDDIQFNPIIINKNDIYEFYQIEKKKLSYEINNIFSIKDTDISKLQLIRYTIKQNISLIKNIYRMLLNYMERPDCFEVNHEIVFEKDKPYFFPSLELLKKRMIGYNSQKTKNIINEFLESDSKNFDLYLKEIIQEDLTNIHLFLNSGNWEAVNNNFNIICFNNSRDIFNLICNIEKQIETV